MINPIRYAFIQETQVLGEPDIELVEVCYAHDCVWLSMQGGATEEEMYMATRYEFDFSSPEMAYLVAKRMMELLEKENPGIAESAKSIRERFYPLPTQDLPS